MDHLARRRGEVAADLERARLGLGQLPRADVVEHVGEALEQVLAAGLDRPLQHLRVGQREVGRAHRVDEACGWRSAASAASRRRARRSRRPSRAAGRRTADRSCGWCRTPDSRCHPGAAKRRSLRLALPRRVDAEHLAPGLQPLGPGLRRRRSSAPSDRPCVAERPAERRRNAPQARRRRGQGCACFSLSAQASISICCARPITQVQCCQSSRDGIAAGRVVSSVMPPLLVIASEPASSCQCIASCALLAMTRPWTRRLPQALDLLDYFGIAVFAVSGALLAAEKTADPRHLHLLRGRDRGRRRHIPRPADRRAGVLGAHQRAPADLHRRRARRAG